MAAALPACPSRAAVWQQSADDIWWHQLAMLPQAVVQLLIVPILLWVFPPSAKIRRRF